MPNIQKLALPMWTSLNINSIQSAFSKWQNLQTLIIHPFISMTTTVREVSSVEFQAIGENCRNLTTIKFTTMLSKDLANIIVCNFPSLERVSFRCNYACIEASISLIIGLPNLKIFNLSHCIFTQNTGPGRSCIIGMRPRDELVQAGTKKLVRFMVCCSDCTICQDVWKHANNPNRYGLEFRYVKEERWKTDEIKELEILYEFPITLGDTLNFPHTFYVSKDSNILIQIDECDETNLVNKSIVISLGFTVDKLPWLLLEADSSFLGLNRGDLESLMKSQRRVNSKIQLR
ncbi:hypothetical protein YC2023_114549 [Brassica napus]